MFGKMNQSFGLDPYSISQEKSRVSNSVYPSYFHPIPPTNYSLPSIPPPLPPPIPKRSIPSKINKRPRLTALIRREILKLKSSQPTIFIWEIQQNLLQNGICTSQTLPTVKSFSHSHFQCISFLLACRHSTCTQ